MPASGISLSHLTRGASAAVVSVGKDGGVADALSRMLAVHGVSVLDGADAVVRAKAVVLLCDLQRGDEVGEATGIATAAIQMARRFAEGGVDGRAFIVVQAGSRCFAGLARTAALEWPKTTVRLLSIAPGSTEELATTIHRELSEGGDMPEVILSGRGIRQIPRDVERGVEIVGAQALPDDPVLLVTGGARGVTAACVIAFARKTKCRLALIRRGGPVEDPAELASFKTERELIGGLARLTQARGETVTPAALTSRARAILGARESAATVTAIQSLGSQAMLISADIADSSAVTYAVAEVRHMWGRIDGIVHGAGMLADRAIADKTEDQARMVIDAKMAGLRHLLDATAQDALCAIVLFSSVAGRYGNLGQVDYAMANAGLVSMAHTEAQRRGSECLVRAIDWGAWDGGMVSDSLRANFVRQGVPLIELDIGAQAFVTEIHSPGRAPEDVHIALVPQQSAAGGFGLRGRQRADAME